MASSSGSVATAVNWYSSSPCGSAASVSTVGAWLPAGSVTVIVIVLVAVAPEPSSTVTFAVYVPFVPYVWGGFCRNDVTPSPTSHLYFSGLAGPSGSVPVALKATVRRAGPLVTFALASTVGGWTPG